MAHRHLTREDREEIYMLLKSRHTKSEIAKKIGVCYQTISREIKRNSGQKGYRPKQAHRMAQERRKRSTKKKILVDDHAQEVEKLLKKKHSPAQISGRLTFLGLKTVSTETIYKYIREDRGGGGKLYKCLRRSGKKRRKKCYSTDNRVKIRNRCCISERPAVVEEKSRIGDWEGDTVIGKNHKGALITLVERVSKFTLVAQVNSKESKVVIDTMIKMLKPYQAHTVTLDNGLEFAQHERLAQELNAKVYFARPYQPWERGLNENTNGLIRQYYPKGKDLLNISKEELDKNIKQLNQRPRKTLGFQTPEEVLLKHQGLKKMCI